jgi:hypothetical protein
MTTLRHTKPLMAATNEGERMSFSEVKIGE